MTGEPVQPRLIGEHQAATILGISVKTLRRWRWRCPGECVPFVKVGRAVRYDLGDIERYIAARRQGAGAG